jgi:hypothetical protein
VGVLLKLDFADRCDRKVQPTAADRPQPYSFRVVSLVVYGLDLCPHGIYKLSLWNDSDSWVKLLKKSSLYIYGIYVYRGNVTIWTVCVSFVAGSPSNC